MMRILIVDDEPLARERLVAMLREMDAGEVVGQAANGVAAIEATTRLRPDVVLLDIRMPGMDGLEAAQHLAYLAQPPALIFTTAFGEHALEAFDAHAVDYLLKPIRAERLRQALDKARVLTEARLAVVKAQSPAGRTHLSAVVKGSLQLVPVAEIRYLQADQKYVTAAWPGGCLLIEDSLKSLEAEFGDRFVRIHRNALVALRYVEVLERDTEGGYQVRIAGMPERLKVSRRLQGAVRRQLKVS